MGNGRMEPACTSIYDITIGVSPVEVLQVFPSDPRYRHSQTIVLLSRLQPKVKSRSHGKSGRQLPGWGRVANPADWKVVDEADDNDGGGSAAVSRIVAQMQPLDLSSDYPALAVAEAGSASQRGLPSLPAADASSKPAAGVGPATSLPPVPAAPLVQAQHVQEDDIEEEEEEAGEGADWAVAGKSKNAERHRRRKQIRWEGRQPQQQPDGSSGPSGRAPLTEAATTTSAATAAEAAAKAMQEEEEEELGRQGKGEDAAPMSDGDEDGDEDMEEGDSDEDSDDDDEDGEEGQEEGEEGEEETVGGSEVGTETTTADEILHINTTSTVLSVTSDFAMQNVLLQMGLRLVSRDGQQISR